MESYVMKYMKPSLFSSNSSFFLSVLCLYLCTIPSPTFCLLFEKIAPFDVSTIFLSHVFSVTRLNLVHHRLRAVRGLWL